ncbi:MAG: hypothetical protein D6746_16795 [Bacteroidetes bacterium]|nr:MAG: hypothetical protein D6746_16795 [Bacteroidota bacterium]
MLRKPRMVALSKMDLVAPDEQEARIAAVRASFPEDLTLLPISAVTGAGLDDLRRALWERIQAVREAEAV